ncbi:minor capsid protein [Lactobacillus hominis]|uniref:Putative phage head protein n=1 Tax=Lactobacillus hominis DSM 23910 = CRBIP 24.179 TaxID=1423758 RepID=I7JV05_9LACO|nr:minor capsid protein [Lactobacillus hominis]KRM85757.1 phage head protein [Lactobacillus hominis DSM 23910 = CRBIP 24.179]MCT3347195.1 phage head morphogenesis protein [Lactobacillus hominis]CCI81996.1 Putative phage head protein [Lactobacillus hominis DSM 23910 = CRBIP 24.179]
MKSSTYWRNRGLQAKKKRLEDSAEYELAMKSRLKDLEKEVEKETLNYLQRYASENSTDLKQAAKDLSHSTNWSMTLDEFEAKARAGGYEKELNTEYYKSRIYRLQQLHDQMVEFGKKYGASEELRMRDSLIKVFNDTYLRQTYNKQVLDGKININFSHFNEKELENIVYHPWKGSDFSKRIWKNYTQVLPDALTDAMLRGTFLGYSSEKVVKILREQVSNVANNNLHRLVVTEMGHAAEEATYQFYKDSDIEKYQYLATLESRTCDQCAHLDEKIFKVSEKREGINYPLIHPYCRCTTVPYMDDLPNLETRWSRDRETGKGTFVKNQTFSEWATGKKQNRMPTFSKWKKLTGVVTLSLGL